MSFPTFSNYLAQLSDPPRPAGRAQGRFFNCTIAGTFQPIRAFGGTAIELDARHLGEGNALTALQTSL